MTTRTKLNISIGAWCVMVLLVVFWQLLQMSDAFRWLLLGAAFVPLAFMFRYIKALEREKKEQRDKTETSDKH
jgi:hypothetical protein